MTMEPDALMRNCNKCKPGRIPSGDPWKACVACREKRRTAKRSKAALSAVVNPGILVAPLGNANVATTNAKRKAANVLEEDLPKVLERMKKRAKLSTDKPKSSPVIKSLPAAGSGTYPNYVEYQTASDMYKGLMDISLSKPLQFRGSYSIIAVSTVNNANREKLVAEELKKIAKLHFLHDKPLSRELHMAFKCTCLANNQPQQRHASLLHAIATSGAPIPKQNDLVTWRGFKPTHHLPNGTAADCKGKITVFAEDDLSHPIGIKGQKIMVTIEH